MCSFLKLSSTSSLPINLTIVSKTKPRLKLSSTYPQSDLTQNQLNMLKNFLNHLTLSASFFLSTSNSIFPISLWRRYWANPADTLCDYARDAEPRWVACWIHVVEPGNVLRNHHQQQQQ